MSDLPTTIYSPEKFLSKPPAGFDGAFDWSWTNGCFGETAIRPMDFDGVVERKGNFLVFETKEAGKDLPVGQRLTLESALKTGHFTVMLLWGKVEPDALELWTSQGARLSYKGVNEARGLVRAWFEWANRNPKRPIDVTFLNRRIQLLEAENERLAQRMREAIGLLSDALEGRK